MKHCENANVMRYMSIYRQISKTQPKNFSKYSSIFKNPKNFTKNPKPRSKCVKCMNDERLEKHTRGKKQGLYQNPSREDEWVDEKVFRREKEVFMSREIEENEIRLFARSI